MKTKFTKEINEILSKCPLMPVTSHIKNKTAFYVYICKKYNIDKIYTNLMEPIKEIDFKLSPPNHYALLGTCTEEYLKLLHNNFASDDDVMFLRGAAINSAVDKEFAKKQNNLLNEALRLGLNSGSGRVGVPVSKKFSEYLKYIDLLNLIKKYGDIAFKLTKNFDWTSLNEHVVFGGGLKKGLNRPTPEPLILGDGDLLFGDKLVDVKVKKKSLFTIDDIVQQIMYYDLSNNAEWLNGEVSELWICNPIYNFLKKIEIFYN